MPSVREKEYLPVARDWEPPRYTPPPPRRIHGGAVKFTASSSGLVVYHNTLLAPVKPMLLAASNVHYRNNLSWRGQFAFFSRFARLEQLVQTKSRCFTSSQKS